jgi:hypothetical protein
METPMPLTPEYNDEPLTDDEKLAALRHAGERAGWDDPELDVYEEYRERPETRRHLPL